MAEYSKNAGAATKLNIKTSAGRVVGIRCTNANAAARFFQIHDKATAPAAAETAVRSYLVPAGTAAVPGLLQLGPTELQDFIGCTTGVGWAISTTDTTFTDSATAAEHISHVSFV